MIKKVVILTGGESAERDISLTTAGCVRGALDELGVGNATVLAEGDFRGLIEAASPDAVFIAMHGGQGENGSIQGFLEIMGIPYTGSGVLSSALCMNKIASKQIFSCHGIRTPVWQRIKSPAEIGIDFPVVIKPVCGGSTIATSVVKTPAGAIPAFEAARAQGGEVMAEEYIPGREVTVSILDGGALPVLEVFPEGGFYDYEAKYSEGGSRHILLENVPEKIYESLQRAAEKAFEAAWCSTVGRADFRLDGDKFYILEINTIPGMTGRSLLPEAAAHAGIDFKSLILRILEGAFRKKY